MKVVSVYQGNIVSYSVKSKAQAYRLAMGLYKGTNPDGYYRLLFKR